MQNRKENSPCCLWKEHTWWRRTSEVVPKNWKAATASSVSPHILYLSVPNKTLSISKILVKPSHNGFYLTLPLMGEHNETRGVISKATSLWIIHQNRENATMLLFFTASWSGRTEDSSQRTWNSQGLAYFFMYTFTLFYILHCFSCVL